MNVLVGSTILPNELPTGTNLGYEYYIDASQHSGGLFSLFGGSSDLQEVDNISIIEITDDTNLPRINYEGFSYDGSGNIIPNSGCGSWLFEPQSTNLFTYSESTNNFSTLGRLNCSYSLGNGYDGFNSSCKITNNTFTNSKVSAVIIFNSVFGESNFFTLRVKKKQGWYLLASSGNGCNPFNLKINLSPNGGFISSSGTSTTNYVVQEFSNYYLIGFLTTQNSTTSAGLFNLGFYNNVNFNNYDLTTIEEFNVTAIQWENNQDYATSYIPTSGSTVTRNQDVCNNGGSLATINSTEGVLYFEGSSLVNGGSTRIISLSDGTNDNLVYLRFDVTLNRFFAFARGSGGSYTSALKNGINQTDNNKIAVSWNNTDLKMYINGSLAVFSSMNDLPIGLDRLSFTSPIGGNNIFGKTKALAVWKEALTDAELTALTTI